MTRGLPWMSPCDELRKGLLVDHPAEDLDERQGGVLVGIRQGREHGLDGARAQVLQLRPRPSAWPGLRGRSRL